MKPSVLLLPLCLGLIVAHAAQPIAVAGFTPVKTVGGIAEFTCDANGLDVLLLEDHSAPVLTFMVTVRVGSRNEVTGTTGATHLLEHMMFKGPSGDPCGELRDRGVAARGVLAVV